LKGRGSGPRLSNHSATEKEIKLIIVDFGDGFDSAALSEPHLAMAREKRQRIKRP